MVEAAKEGEEEVVSQRHAAQVVEEQRRDDDDNKASSSCGRGDESNMCARIRSGSYDDEAERHVERPCSKEEEEEPQQGEPFIEKFKENLHHEFAYIDKLRSFVSLLQQENTSLKEEIEDLKDFIFSTKLSHSIGERKDMALLHSKIQTLEAALKIEILKASEYKKELDDAQHVLMRRTRAKVKKGQSFELIIAQKPQEVALASCATPFQDETNESCPICLDEFDIASGWYTLNCKHRYHLICLAQVMPTRARCCVCNQELHKLLYEIFGMANKYPNDARLWDAQTGQPVDFTLEEDIRALANEIQVSQDEAEDEADEEEAGMSNSGEEILVEDDYAGEESSAENEDEASNSELDDNDRLHVEELEEQLDTVDEDREDDAGYSEGEESYVTSLEEEDDPNDPDYTPSQD